MVTIPLRSSFAVQVTKRIGIALAALAPSLPRLCAQGNRNQCARVQLVLQQCGIVEGRAVVTAAIVGRLSEAVSPRSPETNAGLVVTLQLVSGRPATWCDKIFQCVQFCTDHPVCNSISSSPASKLMEPRAWAD
jgi:hypothetical protein